MKNLFPVLAALCCFGILPNLSAVTREGDGARKLQAGNGQLAVLLLLADEESRWAAAGFPQGEAALRQAMTAAPARFCRKEEAKRALRPVFEQSLRAAYRQKAEAIIQPFAAQLSAAERKRLISGKKSFFDGQVRALYEPGFRRVRAELAREQRQMFFHQLRPAAAELEQYNDAQLIRLLSARFQQEAKHPLWEENAELLKSEIIMPAIAEGRLQQKLQLALARQIALPAGLWEAAAAEQYLLKEIPSAVQQKRRGKFCYPLLAATRRAITRRAADLPLERAIAALPRHLSKDFYWNRLVQEPRKHRELSESLRQVVPPLTEVFVSEALKTCAPPAPFRETLIRDPRLKKKAEVRIRAMTAEFQQIRDEFAKVQLEKAWPELVRGEWSPLPEEVENFAASGSRTLPALKGAPNGELFLTETRAVMDRAARHVLSLEVARLEVQRQAVEKLYDGVQLEINSRQRSRQQQNGSWLTALFRGGKTVELAEVIKLYRAETEKHSTPPLFPSIEREIEVRSRAILQRAKAPDPEPKPPVPNNPETKKKKIFLTLHLSGRNDRLQLRFGSWKKDFISPQLPKEELKKELLSRLAAEKGEVSCQIRLLINGDQIYYSTVSELRSFLKSSLTGAEVEDSLQK